VGKWKLQFLTGPAAAPNMPLSIKSHWPTDIGHARNMDSVPERVSEWHRKWEWEVLPHMCRHCCRRVAAVCENCQRIPTECDNNDGSNINNCSSLGDLICSCRWSTDWKTIRWGQDCRSFKLVCLGNVSISNMTIFSHRNLHSVVIFLKL